MLTDGIKIKKRIDVKVMDIAGINSKCPRFIEL
jgi:hypothetical protein